GEIGRMLENLFLAVAFVRDAAKPAKPEALLRTMHVKGSVGVLVMNSVLAGKPDGIAKCQSGQKAHDELKDAAGFESPVREITMQAAAQPERINQTKAYAHQPINQSGAGKECNDRQQMQANNED